MLHGHARMRIALNAKPGEQSNAIGCALAEVVR